MENQNSRIYQEKEKFIELLKQGKNRIEAAEAIGHKEAWACRTIKKIRETEPERLKGTTEEIKSEPQKQDTPQAPQKPQTTPEPSQPIENTPKEEKTTEKANAKTEKQTFSFRAEQNKIENWKLYAETIGAKDIGILWTAALDEYISNHKLTTDQQTVYDLKKKIAEMQRNQKIDSR